MIRGILCTGVMRSSASVCRPHSGRDSLDCVHTNHMVVIIIPSMCRKVLLRTPSNPATLGPGSALTIWMILFQGVFNTAVAVQYTQSVKPLVYMWWPHPSSIHVVATPLQYSHTLHSSYPPTFRKAWNRGNVLSHFCKASLLRSKKLTKGG